jgi:hypothetical protein
MDHTTKPAPGRVRRTVVLAFLLGLAVVGLSQCRGVDESITGVQLTAETSANGKSRCIKQCTRDFRNAVKSENARFKAELRACGRDPRCLTDARREHRENLEDISTAHRVCKRSCYNEGGGRGGR